MKGVNLAEKNGQWKGDDVGKNAVHGWIKRRLQRPSHCEKCGEKKDKLDLANISQKYLRRLDDWEWLCRRCHMGSDGRFKNLIKFQGANPHPCKRCGAITTRRIFCIPCFKENRKEWWRKYNKTPKRNKYRHDWQKQNYEKREVNA